jgi:hypothetical protein
MKRLYSILAIFSLVFVGLTANTQAAYAACSLSGSGTSASPWLISSQAELAQAGLGGQCQLNANQNQYYKLTQNIALTGNWTPLDFGLGSGLGGFDGNGKSITGLNVITGATAGNYAGLFSTLKNSTVTNLRIGLLTVTGDTWVGALAGSVTNSTISDVSVVGNASSLVTGTTGNGQSVGGVIGACSNSTVTNVSIKAVGGDVRGTAYFGGVVGSDVNCQYSGLGARINVSTLSGGSGIAGGVIGTIIPSVDRTYTGLFFNGTLSADQMSGGLVGYTFSNTGNHNITISNSAVRGTVKTLTNTYNPSAFIGNVGNFLPSVTLTNNYSTASYLKNNNVVFATAGLSQGNGITATGNLFEVSGGSSLDNTKATQVAAITSLAVVPGGWSINPIGIGAPSVSNTAWAIDTSVSGALNNGRPMVASLYDTGFWYDSPCAPGTYDAASNGVCVPAELGHYVAMRGQYIQLQCYSGYFQANVGSTSCDAAPIGKYIPGVGATAAIPCPIGSYSAILANYQCDLAPLGYYVDTLMSAAPTPCPAGLTTASLGATALSACRSSAPATYTGPLVTAVQAKTYANGDIELPGSNLGEIKSVKIDSVDIPFEVKDKVIVLHIPDGLSLGVKSLVISSSSGLMTIDGALKIAEKPIAFNVSFSRIKNKLSASVSSPSNLILKLNGKEVASQRGSGVISKTLTLKKGKNFVDVIKDGVLEKRALFTVR